MPRYFFDTYDAGQLQSDDQGLDCETRAEMRDRAITSLPDIARDKLPDGDHHVFAVRVRNDSGVPVFEASLTLTSRWLDKAQTETG